jgi:hypothetical protein
LLETVTIGDSLSSASNEPLGKPACCCLFFVGCLFVPWFALFDLEFKADWRGGHRLFFAAAELKLFSTKFRSRAVDLFFDSGTAAEGARAGRPLGRGRAAPFKFAQSWRECGFRVAPLHAARGRTVALDAATVAGGFRHRFRISLSS